eukprot:CAMPEP_0197664636 /NCGR_PEP_ID=MMETSP1338-20131121/58759_1 /TAXON_ID=43686 ORGANISM="Pelagodinium beii, Strain RCC1491" /NCGR_SAMPLE_ID=MMETSP1338 /ASSEMBLY_ACC=CAM_ASM_000754 /LENGTH=101 /DNA_ID=CAMNT_0043243319 /DNA_START=54 /DNA_END=359 /DNA_ORIENTATION=-
MVLHAIQKKLWLLVTKECQLSAADFRPELWLSPLVPPLQWPPLALEQLSPTKQFPPLPLLRPRHPLQGYQPQAAALAESSFAILVAQSRTMSVAPARCTSS